MDVSRGYIWSFVIALAILAALAVHGFRAALGGRPIFGRTLIEE
jgi:hypothetical protein